MINDYGDASWDNRGRGYGRGGWGRSRGRGGFRGRGRGGYGGPEYYQPEGGDYDEAPAPTQGRGIRFSVSPSFLLACLLFLDKIRPLFDIISRGSPIYTRIYCRGASLVRSYTGPGTIPTSHKYGKPANSLRELVAGRCLRADDGSLWLQGEPAGGASSVGGAANSDRTGRRPKTAARRRNLLAPPVFCRPVKKC